MNKKIYYTKERCLEEAKKYLTRKEFCINSSGSYHACLRNKWIDDVCEHMKEIIKPPGYWTKERCLEEAKKYLTRNEFSEKSHTPYQVSCKNKWIDEVCEHMDSTHKPNKYWTKERCIEIAKNFNNKKEFIKNFSGAYESCRKNKWIDEVCEHMDKLGDLYNKLGYKMIFVSNLNPNKEYIYIGFTYNFKKRINYHLYNKNDNLYKSIIKYELIHKNSFIYHDFIILKEARIKEKENIKFHREEGKYIVLNQTKGGDGGFGNNIIWTKDKCIKELKECKTIKESINKNKSAYISARNNGWLKEIIPNIKHRYPIGYFMEKEKCKEYAELCINIGEFQKIYVTAYRLSLKNDWLDEFFPCDERNKKPNGYWTKENCEISAKKCERRIDLKRNYRGAYAVSLKNKWLDEFFPKK